LTWDNYVKIEIKGVKIKNGIKCKKACGLKKYNIYLHSTRVT